MPKVSKLRVLLAVMLVLPSFATVMVSAEGSNGSGDSTKTTTTTSTPSSTTKAEDSTTTSSGTDSTKDRTELTKRITERKAQLKTALTTAEKVRLQTRCKSSQGKFSSLDGRINGLTTSRSKVNASLVSHLTELETKLKAKNVDTADLSNEITLLKTKIATYDKDLATYQQTVTDLGSMDCSADPTAFKASLETARTQLTKVKADSADIRAYVQGVIKPTLQKIRTSLQKTESTTTPTTSTSTIGGN